MKTKFENIINAVIDNDLDEVKRCIADGLDLNYQNEVGNTALMFAAFYGFDKIILTMLEAGADPNIQSKKGFTALMLASYYDNVESFAILIDAGTNINLVNHKGMTCIDLSGKLIKTYLKKRETIDWLRSKCPGIDALLMKNKLTV